MATMPDVGFGTIIEIAGSTAFFTGLIREIAIDGYERSSVDVTVMTSTGGYREFIPGDLRDPGSATVDILFDVGKLATFKTIIDSTRSAVTITYPTQGGTAASFACSGFVTSHSINAVMDDAMSASVSIKFQGVPTLTAGTTV